MAAAGAAALSQFPFLSAHAAPDDPIRIGLIGCGGRGTGAVADALGAATDVNYPSAGYHTENIKAGAQLANKNVRIVALADVYDALTSKRVYKTAYEHTVSKSIISQESGNHFDPELVTAFLETEGRFLEIREQYYDAPAGMRAESRV